MRSKLSTPHLPILATILLGPDARATRLQDAVRVQRVLDLVVKAHRSTTVPTISTSDLILQGQVRSILPNTSASCVVNQSADTGKSSALLFLVGSDVHEVNDAMHFTVADEEGTQIVKAKMLHALAAHVCLSHGVFAAGGGDGSKEQVRGVGDVLNAVEFSPSRDAGGEFVMVVQVRCWCDILALVKLGAGDGFCQFALDVVKPGLGDSAGPVKRSVENPSSCSELVDDLL